MAGFGGFEGRTAVVTGGASGIGLAIARRLRAEGMNLVIADIDAEALAAAAAEINALAVPVDVSRVGEVEALAEATLAAHGSVDLICNICNRPKRKRDFEAFYDALSGADICPAS